MQKEVIEFVADFTGTNMSLKRLETLVNGELGVEGDDGRELILVFSEKFGVDISNIKKVYFGSEGINPFTIIFHGIFAFWRGLFGKSDSYSPLPVRVLVESAEQGKWINI